MANKIQELLEFAMEEGYTNDALGEVTSEFYQMCAPYLEEYDDEVIYEAYERVLENCFTKPEIEEDIDDIRELASIAIKKVQDIYFNNSVEMAPNDPHTR